MIKKELRKLRKLYPTKTMMQKAGMDVPVLITRKSGWRREDIYRYKYGIYMRCQILNGILKVAFFLAESMRLGGKAPVYELFINKEAGEFMTWDVRREKWRKAKVDMLDWPEYTWHSGRYINPEGYRSIKKHLGTKNGGYKGILEWQRQVRKEELKERYRRETEPWDMKMDQVPPLPKDWEHWVDKTGITQNYIFYEYQRKGAKEGYCTWCEKPVPVRDPRHNRYGKCRRCGRKIQYKAKGKAGSFYTDIEYVYLLQRCEDGAVVRLFRCWRHYQKPDYENPALKEKNIFFGYGDYDFVATRSLYKQAMDADGNPVQLYDNKNEGACWEYMYGLNEAGVSYRSMNYPYGHDWVLWRKLIVDVFDNILWK